MDWIRVDASSPRHPKIGRLAKAIGVPRVQAFGHVVTLWCWAIEHAPDGAMGGLEPCEIAEAAAWSGDPDLFAGALSAVGLVDDDWAVHDWIDMQGRSSRVRAQALSRQRRHRAQKQPVTQERGANSGACHAPALQPVTHLRDKRRVTGVTRDVRDVRTTRAIARASTSSPLSAAADAPAAPESDPEPVPIPGDPPEVPATCEDAIAIWRQECPALPAPRCVTDKRRRAWWTRCQDPEYALRWREACRRVAASRFCRGEGGRGEWRATIDWLLFRPDAAVRAVEGAYDDPPGAPRQPTLGAHEPERDRPGSAPEPTLLQRAQAMHPAARRRARVGVLEDLEFALNPDDPDPVEAERCRTALAALDQADELAAQDVP